MYKKFLKRTLDIALCLSFIIIFWWLYILIAILIKAESKGSIIFKQKRIGKNKNNFYIYKFRTMYSDTPHDIPTHMLSNPENFITKTGKFLRKYSLDELPQIMNILKGDMSIVGPRPALWNQYDLIAERDKHGANDIKPGLTGWAQVSGRDELEIPVKAKYDGEYIQKSSFLFDLKIIFMTFFSVLRAKGIREGTANTKNSDS